MPPIAELRMVKKQQEDLVERFKRLEQQVRAGGGKEIDARERKLLERLSSLQGALKRKTSEFGQRAGVMEGEEK
ncbi:MAG: hypothetical protein HY719_12555 [Planctomycetes bacterium]|nr:hypothetical protein [Planctomycetota bacterium]